MKIYNIFQKYFYTVFEKTLLNTEKLYKFVGKSV